MAVISVTLLPSASIISPFLQASITNIENNHSLKTKKLNTFTS